jgi:hypothetical protein
MEWGSWIGSDQLAGLPRGGSRRVMAAILQVLVMPQGKVKIDNEIFFFFFRKLFSKHYYNFFRKIQKRTFSLITSLMAKTGGA